MATSHAKHHNLPVATCDNHTYKHRDGHVATVQSQTPDLPRSELSTKAPKKHPRWQQLRFDNCLRVQKPKTQSRNSGSETCNLNRYLLWRKLIEGPRHSPVN